MTTTDSGEVPGLALLQFVLDSLVEDKDELQIENRTDDLGILLTVHVSENDMGKVIGKAGQTIKALRTLVRVVGSNSGHRVNLKIAEPPATA